MFAERLSAARNVSQADEPPPNKTFDADECSQRWRDYCAALDANIQWFLSMTQREFIDYVSATSG